MFGLFDRPSVSEDVHDWLTEEFARAVEAGLLTGDTPLVLPDARFFPAGRGSPQAVVEGLVSDILGLLGRTGDEIALIPIDRPGVELRAAGAFETLGEMAGGWTRDGDASIILYDPEMTARPMALLATLVHEVMHHLRDATGLARADAEEELGTDALMLSTGFGLIAMLGGAEAGWSGYLSQPTRAHGLAMFLAATGQPLDEARDRLPGRLARYLVRAARTLDGDPDIAALRRRLAA